MGFDLSPSLEPRPYRPDGVALTLSNPNHAEKWAHFITAILGHYEIEQAHENEEIFVFHAGFIESRLHACKSSSRKSATTSAYSLLSPTHSAPIPISVPYYTADARALNLQSPFSLHDPCTQPTSTGLLLRTTVLAIDHSYNSS